MSDSRREQLLAWYERMLRIRLFEERTAALFKAGRLPGFLHTSEGQEAVAVGMTASLRSDDYITSTHRGHGHMIAKGGSLRGMMAELFGKVTGSCHGRGGSMHIMDMSLGILGANAIVGAGIPIAAGAGLSARLRGTDQVVVCFFGDGAANTGAFHEAINLAAVWDLPVVFCCENNHYAESTPVHATVKNPVIAERGPGYGIPGVRVDGNDLLAVVEAAAGAVARARRGEGPTLIECVTYRWSGHYVGDAAPYRVESEVREWRTRDPIGRFEAYLRSAGILDDGGRDAVHARTTAELDDAIAFAEASPDPDPAKVLLPVEV